jgi:hypothetical protein
MGRARGPAGNVAEIDRIFCLNGGAEGDRTPDLRNAIATLSQLSYGPTVSRAFRECARECNPKSLSVGSCVGAVAKALPRPSLRQRACSDRGSFVKSAWVGVAIVAASCSAGASAQAWVAQIAVEAARSAQIGRCLKGKMSLAQSEVDEVRGPARDLMAGYWARASASDPADVRAAFQSVGTARWTDGATEIRREGMQSLRDPFALNPALTMAQEPTSFARGGANSHIAARGVWAIVSRTDRSQVAGYYVVDFERSMYRWGIARMFLVHAPADMRWPSRFAPIQATLMPMPRQGRGRRPEKRPGARLKPIGDRR